MNAGKLITVSITVVEPNTFPDNRKCTSNEETLATIIDACDRMGPDVAHGCSGLSAVAIAERGGKTSTMVSSQASVICDQNATRFGLVETMKNLLGHLRGGLPMVTRP
jgi:hypothetical protein